MRTTLLTLLNTLTMAILFWTGLEYFIRTFQAALYE